MRKITKITKRFHAYVLGENSAEETRMMQEGKIILTDEGYELFSRETIKDHHGEKAAAGDYFKIDEGDFPYPNRKEFFESKNNHIEGDLYEEKPVTYECWTKDMEMNDIIRFILERKLLEMDEKGYSAHIWGTTLHTGSGGVVVIYGTKEDEDGNLTDVDFNLVGEDVFPNIYHFID